jgi:hypothetical protein
MCPCTGRRPSARERTSPSIAVSIAPEGTTEVRRYGIIRDTLDAVDKLVKKLAAPGPELRVVYKAGPCDFVICRHLRAIPHPVRTAGNAAERDGGRICSHRHPPGAVSKTPLRP